MKKAFVLFVATVAIVVSVLWFRENSVEVYFRVSGRVTDGHNYVQGVHIFKGRNGHLLITLPENSSAPFIYLPESREVLLCNSKTFVDAWKIGFQKRDRTGSYPCAGSAKQEIPQNIEKSERSLAFNAWRKGRKSNIAISW